ncbi:hypothetical protein BH10ACT6_BH10ACT6_00950 [soil metagenome]
MGVLARWFGQEHDSATEADARRLTQYRHVLRTAPLESLEQAHTDAFGELAEWHRAAIYEELSRGAGTGERPRSSEPATLARSATRAERRMPGDLERTLRSADLLKPVVAHVTGSPLVSAFLPWNS